MENIFSPMGNQNSSNHRCIWVNGPVIIGAGPSGLATAACLKEEKVPYIIIEKSNCIASLWQNRTYNRLKLHLPKKFCQLPKMPFPNHFPKYPSKRQFIEYLESYANRFDIKPEFNRLVESARFDEISGLWRVRTVARTGSPLKMASITFEPTMAVEEKEEVEYVCRWLVVATGENAVRNVPEIQGLIAAEFEGEVIHVSEYKSGERYKGKRVVVVGSGNSGMEVSFDLANHKAITLMVVRSPVHVLPKEIIGKSTYEISMILMKFLPLWFVDKILLILAWLVFGSLINYGLKRPKTGPMELKIQTGKTPVLDIGTLGKIKTGEIKVVPEIKRFRRRHVELIDGRKIEVDVVVLATGYRSNVPCWLQENDFFTKNGYPKSRYMNTWKGKSGLYVAGFTGKGLAGISSDAVNIAKHIGNVWRKETKGHMKRKTMRYRSCISLV